MVSVVSRSEATEAEFCNAARDLGGVGDVHLGYVAVLAGLSGANRHGQRYQRPTRARILAPPRVSAERSDLCRLERIRRCASIAKAGVASRRAPIKRCDATLE